MGLTLLAFNDRDLLFALEEAGDDEGWASSEEVARLVGIEDDYPARSVGSRLSWACRYGWIEKRKAGATTLWRLNDAGVALLHAELSPATERRLRDLDEGERAEAIADLAGDLMLGSPAGAHLARRAWAHEFGLRFRDPRLLTNPRKRKNGRKR